MQKIDIFSDYYFEFHTHPDSTNPDFLGQEYLYGTLKHHGLQTLCPNLNLTILPLLPTRLDQTFLIQNLGKTSFFKEFDEVLVDWPQEFTPHLPKICDAFAHPLCLTTKDLFEKGFLEEKSTHTALKESTEDLYFIEPFCSRRHALHYLKTASFHCVGSNKSDLKNHLDNRDKITPYLLTQGLLPWLSAQFLNCEKKNSADEIKICKKIIECLSTWSTKKILLIASFEILSTLDALLKEHQDQFTLSEILDKKVVHFKSSVLHAPLFLAQPTQATCLDYSSLNGFVSRKLFANESNPHKTSNWREDFQNILTKLFQQVQLKYNEWTKTQVSPSETRDFFRFAYRLAQDNHAFFPSTFDWLVSAKAVINANFAYELHKEFQDFPAHEKYKHALKPIDIPVGALFKKTQQVSLQKFATIQSHKATKKIKLHAVNKTHNVKSSAAVSEEKYADNSWVHDDHPYSCSFPNEDIFMEKLALECKKNKQQQLKEKETIYKELQSDLGEGLALRETIRNWHKGKLIVKDSAQTGKADIGAVIFGFATPEEDEKFSWKSFWLAEQHDDSHLMFYATPFKDCLIGPGIAKSEFGGFAVIPIESYIEHPWHHPYILGQANTNTECLILAGALSSSHKSVLFISHHPPTSHIIKILKQSGKHILYARPDEFSQTDMRRVKTFHILAEAGVRNYAEKYIRKD